MVNFNMQSYNEKTQQTLFPLNYHFHLMQQAERYTVKSIENKINNEPQTHTSLLPNHPLLLQQR